MRPPARGCSSLSSSSSSLLTSQDGHHLDTLTRPPCGRHRRLRRSVHSCLFSPTFVALLKTFADARPSSSFRYAQLFALLHRRLRRHMRLHLREGKRIVVCILTMYPPFMAQYLYALTVVHRFQLATVNAGIINAGCTNLAIGEVRRPLKPGSLRSVLMRRRHNFTGSLPGHHRPRL